MSNTDDVRKIEVEQKMLKRAYQAIQETPAMVDLLAWLESERTQAMSSAENEMDNPAKRGLYLQNAIAYGKVTSHLKRKFSDEHSPK